MDQFNFLKKLSGFEPDGLPFISAYLNTGPNQNGKRDFDVFLKKQINDHAAVLALKTEGTDGFDRASERINDFLAGIETSTGGAAIFASAGAEGFFKGFQFSAAFDENEFIVREKPFIYPLVRLMEQNPRFAVVLADTNSAQIWVFREGRLIDQENIQNVKTNRTEVGGWSQSRYQRHIDNFHQQHAKEVVAELEQLMSSERIDSVVLAGDQAVIIPLLREEMSKELSGKIVASLPLNVNTPEHELAEAAGEAMCEHDASADKEKIARLEEQNYDGGIGVVGVEKTLTALLNGQVQELYITGDPSDITYDRNAVEDVIQLYQPGEEGELPEPRRHRMLIDELLIRAADSADEIRFIEDPNLLKTSGGVGALLRYQVRGVSNL